jgi:hypothetical protein
LVRFVVYSCIIRCLSHGFYLKEYYFLFVLPSIIQVLLLQKPVWRAEDINTIVMLDIDKPVICYGEFTTTLKPEKTQTDGTNDNTVTAC